MTQLSLKYTSKYIKPILYCIDYLTSLSYLGHSQLVVLINSYIMVAQS